jgi:peroxiredoxin
MNGRTRINGWTISRGDYIPDFEYCDENTKRMTKRNAAKRMTFAIITIYIFTAICSYMISTMLL